MTKWGVDTLNEIVLIILPQETQNQWTFNYSIQYLKLLA